MPKIKKTKRIEYLDSDDTSSNEEEEEEEEKSTIDSSIIEESIRSELNSTNGTTQNMSNVELPGTDEESESDDEIRMPTRRKSNVFNKSNFLSDSEAESDNEEVVERRKTIYREHPEGDDEVVEDNVYSKATRKSIHGYLPIKDEPVVPNDPTGNESDDDVIILDSDDDEEVENDNRMSSTMNSSETKSPESLINKSNITKNESDSSTSNAKDESEAQIDESISNGNNNSERRVSLSFYNQALRERQALEDKLVSISRAKGLQTNLPDNGKKLNDMAEKIMVELEEKKREIKLMVVDEQESIQNRIKRSFNDDPSYQASMGETSGESTNNSSVYLVTDDVKPKFTGKVGMKNFNDQKALIEEKLQDIHESLNQRPADDVESKPPKHLKITLMKHQLQALAFMEWREANQKPRGGLLADDMGLGKTLTAISLIMKQMQTYEERPEEESDSEDEERDEWIAQGRRDLRAGGTLVICPATLLKQWEYEIKTKVKRGALETCVFYGSNRPTKSRDLAHYDVVITTYQIIVSEHKTDGCIFGLRWDRIILDEGHAIKNCKSKQAEAVCSLEAKHRWVMTGTPVQTKEFDIYSIIKFLRFSPFDNIRYWNTWIEVRGENRNSPRLQALLKSILLRRTKAQLIESGQVESLPNKVFELVMVELNPTERLVYNKVMAFSQAILAEYIQQNQEKHNNYTYDKAQLGKYYSKMSKMFNGDKIEQHEILTLLLRLRQVCCHPGLMKQMLENTDLADTELNTSLANESDPDIVSQLERMKITTNTGNLDQMMTQTTISLDDDVFNFDIPSSKLEKLIDVLNEKIVGTSDKAIIVSQWVSYLNIVKGMLDFYDIPYCELNGKVPVKDRNDLVVNFNKESSKEKVMLLSITAGGVGLNLVGANMLFILDPHWNPQIELQAQDRIYRFGQKKNVTVIKFICEDTIEEKILKIQKVKLEVATSTLTGSKRSDTKLTIDDLKDLFGMNK